MSALLVLYESNVLSNLIRSQKIQQNKNIHVRLSEKHAMTIKPCHHLQHYTTPTTTSTPAPVFYTTDAR